MILSKQRHLDPRPRGKPRRDAVWHGRGRRRDDHDPLIGRHSHGDCRWVSLRVHPYCIYFFFYLDIFGCITRLLLKGISIYRMYSGVHSVVAVDVWEDDTQQDKAIGAEEDTMQQS